MRGGGWTFVAALIIIAPMWIWAFHMTLRRNRMTVEEARASIRRDLSGAECVHIPPRSYPVPPLEIIRIATQERAYVYAGSSRIGMVFRRGDVAHAQVTAHNTAQTNSPHPRTRVGPVQSPRYARGVFSNLKQHGYWPYRRRRAPEQPPVGR